MAPLGVGNRRVKGLLRTRQIYTRGTLGGFVWETKVIFVFLFEEGKDANVHVRHFPMCAVA